VRASIAALGPYPAENEAPKKKGRSEERPEV
jgi:hypothetical protein